MDTETKEPTTFKNKAEETKFRKKLAREAAAKLDLEGLRMCTKCGRVKPHSHMKTDKKRPFGIQRICKDCDNFVWPKTAKWKAIAKARRIDAKAKSDPVVNAVNKHFPSTDYFDINLPVDPINPPPPYYPVPDSSGFRTCQYCGCFTNARVRACCDLGRDQDNVQSLIDVPALDTPDGTIPSPPPEYPDNEPTSDDTKQRDWWDKFFANQRIADAKKIQEKDLPAGLIPHPTEVKPKPVTVNPMAEIDMKKVVSSALESVSQKALRQKMKIDGFSDKMTNIAVKLLPVILRELKSLDQTILEET